MIEVKLDSKPGRERYFDSEGEPTEVKLQWMKDNPGFWLRWARHNYPKSAQVTYSNDFERWRGGATYSFERGLWIRYVGAPEMNWMRKSKG